MEHPLPLKGDPLDVPEKDNVVSTWAEFLHPTTAKPLAFTTIRFWTMAGDDAEQLRRGDAAI